MLPLMVHPRAIFRLTMSSTASTADSEAHQYSGCSAPGTARMFCSAGQLDRHLAWLARCWVGGSPRTFSSECSWSSHGY